jgi:hypothetical protein
MLVTAGAAGAVLVTVIAADADFPPLVTVSVAEPAPVPVAYPVVSTDTTALLLLDQSTLRPLSTNPLASVSVALNCACWPTVPPADVGESVIDAMGSPLTDVCAWPVMPLIVATIVA